MNLTELFDMQKKLDKEIEKKCNTLNPKFTKKEMTLNRTIALMVEAGEFINEVQTFKYWKHNKLINKSNILEEFADLLHFYLTLAYENNVYPEFKPFINEYNDINLQFKELFISISNLMNNTTADNIRKSIEIALGSFVMLGYNYSELYQAYFFKNQKNYKRLYSDY
ncbi:dUTP diphosphatase [Mycoplasmopsis cynos]|uniref:dUTP diphosphatase n=1 Tax=Mycoplasmopsis cynos TaxID=171284 RepID=UPI002AFF719E|nr:dUTP diphosphatase [Mycoplasmopsis cynos]WQQ15442.1 dUTP diphosphatase [Mycoplasmopsis cynos]